jgi:uncharacterized protein YjiS (DUF1127 family)
MSAHFSTRPTPHSPAIANSVAHAALTVAESMGFLIDRVLEWQDRREQRRHLLALDDHLLKDIGITRIDAEVEGFKPFWKH